MALSPILSIPLLSTNQSNKETTINNAINFLEKANNSAQTVNFAAGDVTLALLDIQRFFLFKVTGATASRQLIVPAANKIFAVDNSLNAFPLTVVRGSSTLTLEATTVGMIYIDGTRLVFLWYSANGGSIPFTFLSDTPDDYVDKAGQFLRVNLTETGIDFAPAGAAVADFTDLSDVPSAYTGHAGALVRVKADVTGLEFLDQFNFTNLTGVPTSFTDAGGYYVRVKSDETGLEFVAAGGGDSFLGLSDTPDDYTGKGGNMAIVSPDESGMAFTPIPSWATILTELADVPDDYAGAAGFFLRVNDDGTGIEFVAGGSEGAHNFLELDDAPVSYAGAGGFYIRIKDDESGLEFHAPEGSADYPEFTGNAGKALIVNDTEDGVEWGSAPGGGISLGGAHVVGSFQTTMSPSVVNSTSAFAVKGNLLVTTDVLQVLGASVTIAGSSGETYKLVVGSFDTTTNQLTTILGVSDSQTVETTKTTYFQLDETVSVPANTGLALLVVRTDDGATGVCHVPFEVGVSGHDGPGYTFYGSSRYASTDPEISDGILFDTTSSMGIDLFYFVGDGLVDLGANDTITINTQTANYVLQLSDSGQYIRMAVATANDLTVPTNATAAFPIGTQIPVRQAGAGQTTIVAASGVTINTAETLKLRKQHSTASLVKVGVDEWDLTGDLEELP